MRWIPGLLLLAAVAPASDSNCDTGAVRWFLPHQFEEARAAAAKSGRPLVIKGIAFGVDAAGARSATAGCW